MEKKTMLLYRNYRTTIYEGKKTWQITKTRKRLLTMENTMVIYPKEWNFLNKYNALEL